MNIRALRPDEIELRVSQITANGFQLLPYKDARVDMALLDETFGIFGWKDYYKEIKGNLYCTISIWDDDKKQWIEKEDCGVESGTEKQKGEASDAFKRAATRVGIGRELYSKIFIFIKGGTKQVMNGKEPTLKNGKPIYKLENPYEKYRVAEIIVDEATRKITYLRIIDSKNESIFSYGIRGGVEQITKSQVVVIDGLAKSAKVDIAAMVEFYGVNTFNEMSQGQYNEAINTLNKRLKAKA